MMRVVSYMVAVLGLGLRYGMCRDEEKISKACYWPNEVYEACFGGCAEVSCDNPRNHLRPCYPYCEPGCVCEEPYVRDDRTHQCVLPQDCSPTQMGIPVPSKRANGKPAMLQYDAGPKFTRRHSGKRPEHQELMEVEGPPRIDNNHVDEIKRPDDDQRIDDRRADISRMGNYFNIVIAPPPIRALQPRKLMQSDGFRTATKRM